MRVIGIAGGSGSGKTTFTKEFIKAVGAERVAVIAQDSYYLDQSANFKGDGSVNFDHPDSIDWKLMRTHLAELHAGKTIACPIYDFATHTRRKETLPIESKRYVLVDGILIFVHKEMRDQMDLKIYIDCPEDVRFARRLKRDVAERGRTAEGVRTQILEHVKPMHDQFVEPSGKFADVHVSGERPFQEPIAEILRKYLGESV